MKLAFLVFLAFSAAFSTVSAAQVRANGVTAENGWIDYAKTSAEHDGDDQLCWAASATLSLLALAVLTARRRRK